MQAYGGVEVELHSFLTLALGGVGVHHHASAVLPPGKSAGIHCAEGWVDLRVGLNGCGENLWTPPGLEPQTPQSVASRNTDYAPSDWYEPPPPQIGWER
jgi:hypothetical protein